MKDYSKFIGVFGSASTDTIKSLMEEELKALITKNNEVINDYFYLTSKIEEINYRQSPSYTLSVVNKKDIDKGYILAKVKWPYMFKGRIKTPPYISIHLGSLKKYPKGVNDPNLQSDIHTIIQNYLNEYAPFELINQNGDSYIVK